MNPEDIPEFFKNCVVEDICTDIRAEYERRINEEFDAYIKSESEKGLQKIAVIVVDSEPNITKIKEEILKSEKAITEGRLREPPEPKTFNDFNIKSIMNNSKIADE